RILVFLLSVLSVDLVASERATQAGWIRTDAFVLMKEGEILHQEYHNGYQPEQPHRLWSLSKSIWSLVVARAVHEGRIDPLESVCAYIQIPLQVTEDLCLTSVEDILHWQSGVEWRESHFSGHASSSSVLRILYGEGR